MSIEFEGHTYDINSYKTHDGIGTVTRYTYNIGDTKGGTWYHTEEEAKQAAMTHIITLTWAKKP